MLRRSFARLRAHPKSLWTVVLGATLVVPIIFAALTLAMANQIAPLAGTPFPLYALAGLFGLAFVVAASYSHALVINAAAGVRDDEFGFLDLFRDARGFYGRTILLNVLFGFPPLILAGVGFLVSGVLGVASLVTAGAWILLAAFLFLRAPVHLKEHSLLDALSMSFAEIRTRQHYVRWGWSKLCALLVTAVFFVGAYSIVAAAAWWVQLALAFVYFLVLLNGLLSPLLLFAALLMYGAQGAWHFLIVLLSQLVFFLFVHVLLALDR